MSRHGDTFNNLREELAAEAMVGFLDAPLDSKRDNSVLMRNCRILS